MSKIVKLTESQLRRVIKNVISEIEMAEDDLDYKSFYEDPKLEKLRDAINKKKIVSVSYVKTDGVTVRHMAFKNGLDAYIYSDKPKTEKQANVSQNNDSKKVIDINVYIKNLEKYGNDKQKAATGSWRTVNLKNVLAFLVGGKLIDLRDENEIKERFGEEVYHQLTNSMIAAMERENELANKVVNDVESSGDI